jgi:hypothetical protein
MYSRPNQSTSPPKKCHSNRLIRWSVPHPLTFDPKIRAPTWCISAISVSTFLRVDPLSLSHPAPILVSIRPSTPLLHTYIQ